MSANSPSWEITWFGVGLSESAAIVTGVRWGVEVHPAVARGPVEVARPIYQKTRFSVTSLSGLRRGFLAPPTRVRMPPSPPGFWP